MLKIKIYILLFLLIIFFNLTYSKEIKIPTKKIMPFIEQMPFIIGFRGERRRDLLKNYANWENHYKNYSAIIRKYTNEELNKLPLENIFYAKKFHYKYPATLNLLHFNGEARQTYNDPLLHQRYFSGHWVYLSGTTVLSAITSSTQQIKVKNSQVFSLSAYKKTVRNKKISLPHDALLVSLDEQGNRLWYQSEYVKINFLNQQKNIVGIKRAQYFSKAHSFKAHKTLLLPLAATIWGGQPMWFYNHSTQSPRDKNGKQASDILAKEIQQTLYRLNWLDGITFDVMHWRARKNWDTNNDNVADGGYLQNINEFARGNLSFLTKVRRLLPVHKIITADGHQLSNQRAIHLLNGIESEGTVRHNDAFRAFSNTVNLLNFWQTQQNYRPQFSYLVQKFRNPRDIRKQQQLTRFGVGMASIYAVGSAFIGRQNLSSLYVSGWLGKPISAIKRLALDYPINLPISPPQALSNTKIEKNKTTLFISPLKQQNTQPMRLSWSLPKPKQGDLLLEFTIRSLGSSLHFPNKPQIPRAIQIIAKNLPNFKEGHRNQTQYIQSHGFFNALQPQKLSFYFRQAARAKGTTLNLIVKIEQSLAVKIDQIALYSAADIHWREFENGYLFLNPSLTPQTVDLTELIDNKIIINRLSQKKVTDSILIPAIDAIYLQKIIKK